MESANTSSMRECVRKGLNRKRVGSVFLVILFHAKEGLKDKCEAFFWHARKVTDAGKPAEPVGCDKNALWARRRREEDTVRREPAQ